MAWDVEETKRRLKEAAVEEFAAFGLSGARVDRIARLAGVNKERIYGYFGNKEQLFATVLSDELARIAAAVPLSSVDAGDVAEYAGRVFDYHADHPRLVRMLHWEALSYGEDAAGDGSARARYYQQKVSVFAAAQRAGALPADPGAAHLVFLVLALSAWWFAVPQVARLLTGQGDGVEERARRRAAVVEAARRLATAAPTSDQPIDASRRAQGS